MSNSQHSNSNNGVTRNSEQIIGGAASSHDPNNGRGRRRRRSLPPALQEGGQFDTVLAATREAIKSEQQLKCLHDRVANELNSLRRSWMGETSGFASDPDPVLHFLWESHTSQDHQYLERCQSEALNALYHKFDVYRSILGDLIPADLVEHIELLLGRDAYRRGDNSNAKEDMPLYHHRLRERRQQRTQSGGLTTGLPSLDALIGGYRDITLLGADTQVGKSFFAIQTAVAALRNRPDSGLLYFALDHESRDEIYDKIFCASAGVNPIRYCDDDLTFDEQQRVEEAELVLNNGILNRIKVVDDQIAARHIWRDKSEGPRECVGLTHHFISQQQAILQSEGIGPVITVIDMLQGMPVPSALQADSNRSDEWRLEQLRKAFRHSSERCPGGSPILAICETRKTDRERGSLGIRDILGSTKLGYKGKRILLVSPDKDADPTADVILTHLSVAKCTGGRCGEIDLAFHHTESRFEEVKTASEMASTTKQAASADRVKL
jgi:hypothetical protein